MLWTVILLLAGACALVPHPQFQHYFEQAAQLQPELLDQLADLGRNARVLIPYYLDAMGSEVRIPDPDADPNTAWQEQLWNISMPMDEIWGQPIAHHAISSFKKLPISKFVSSYALASLEELVEMDWLRVSRTRLISKCLAWRLAQRSSTVTMDTYKPGQLEDFDMVQFFSLDDSISSVYQEYEARVEQGLPVPEVFEIVPSSRDIFLETKPDLWANMTRISYGSFLNVPDFMIPELSYVVPFGATKLSDTLLHRPGSTHRRSNLLCFLGSIRGTLHRNFLGYERQQALRSLASSQARMLEGASTRRLNALRAAFDASALAHLFVTPSTELGNYTGLMPFEFGNVSVVNKGHMFAAWDTFRQEEVILTLALQASSHYCFHPGGDTHLRHGVFDAWQMGCIPVIYSTALEHCATLFGGLLFRASVRLEDVVKIVVRERVIGRPADIYREMLLAVDNGEAAQMRSNIRKMVDHVVMRLDDKVPDAFTLALGVVRYRQRLTRKGKMPALPPIAFHHIPKSNRTTFRLKDWKR